MNKNKLFFLFFGILFILFLGLYIANASGYYQTVQKKKTVLTNEKIKQFESDIEEGKSIDIDSYVEKNTKKYNTKTSDKLYSISTSLSNGLDSVFKFLFKEVSNYVENS